MAEGGKEALSKVNNGFDLNEEEKDAIFQQFKKFFHKHVWSVVKKYNISYEKKGEVESIGKILFFELLDDYEAEGSNLKFQGLLDWLFPQKLEYRTQDYLYPNCNKWLIKKAAPPINAIRHQLRQKLERDPTPLEIAEEWEISPDKLQVEHPDDVIPLGDYCMVDWNGGKKVRKGRLRIVKEVHEMFEWRQRQSYQSGSAPGGGDPDSEALKAGSNLMRNAKEPEKFEEFNPSSHVECNELRNILEDTARELDPVDQQLLQMETGVLFETVDGELPEEVRQEAGDMTREEMAEVISDEVEDIKGSDYKISTLKCVKIRNWLDEAKEEMRESASSEVEHFLPNSSTASEVGTKDG